MRSQTVIAALITRVQDAFLDIPGLSMTLEQAQRLFHIDRATCQALFDILTESAVVTRTQDGAFVRPMPHGVSHAA
jgi:hypothetical protein